MTSSAVGALPQLRYAFTIDALVAPDRRIGDIDEGELIYIPITGGRVHGGIEGEVLEGGGDWCVVKGHYCTVEARYQVRTADGDVVDVLNTGVAHFVDDAQLGVGYFPTRPVFRVENPALRHLVDRVHLGWARSTPEVTAIDIFEVLDPVAVS